MSVPMCVYVSVCMCVHVDVCLYECVHAYIAQRTTSHVIIQALAPFLFFPFETKSLIDLGLVCQVDIANVIWEEGASAEKVLSPAWPAGDPVENLPD